MPHQCQINKWAWQSASNSVTVELVLNLKTVKTLIPHQIFRLYGIPKLGNHNFVMAWQWSNGATDALTLVTQQHTQ